MNTKPTYQDFINYKFGVQKMGFDANRAFQLACEWLKSMGSSYKEVVKKS